MNCSLYYLFNLIITMITYIILYLKSFCKPKKESLTPKLIIDRYIPACVSGNLDHIKDAINLFLHTRDCDYSFELSRGLTEAVKSGHVNIAEYLIDQGASNLDENLKIACNNSNIQMAELLARKGANVVVGLRVSKSPNITKMLYRFRQNSDLINY